MMTRFRLVFVITLVLLFHYSCREPMSNDTVDPNVIGNYKGTVTIDCASQSFYVETVQAEIIFANGQYIMTFNCHESICELMNPSGVFRTLSNIGLHQIIFEIESQEEYQTRSGSRTIITLNPIEVSDGFEYFSSKPRIEWAVDYDNGHSGRAFTASFVNRTYQDSLVEMYPHLTTVDN